MMMMMMQTNGQQRQQQNVTPMSVFFSLSVSVFLSLLEDENKVLDDSYGQD
jgi:hypothetical protein